MPHVFFEPLEKRQSTQTLFSGFPEFVTYYGISPGYTGTGSTQTNWVQFLYGVSTPTDYPTGGYFPWWPGSISGGSGYNPWTNPINRYNPWTNPINPYNPGSSWGSFPIWDYIGGLFGGSFPGWSWRRNQPSVPDFRLLYGVFPTPQPLYGIGISPAPPTEIITYYGISVSESVSTIFSTF